MKKNGDSIWNWLFACKSADNKTGFGLQYRGSNGAHNTIAIWPSTASDQQVTTIGNASALWSGSWAKYDVVLNGKTTALYINGTLLGSVSNYGNKIVSFPDGVNFTIGGQDNTSTRALRANVDEFRIRKNAADAAYVAAQFAAENDASFLTAEYSAAGDFSASVTDLVAYNNGAWSFTGLTSGGTADVGYRLISGSVTNDVIVTQDAAEGSHTLTLSGLTANVFYEVYFLADDYVRSAGSFYNGEITVSAQAGDCVTFGTFTFTRTGTAGSISVTYEAGGTCVEGVDYAPLSGTVVIPDGQTSADVVVQALAGTATTSDTLSLTVRYGPVANSASINAPARPAWTTGAYDTEDWVPSYDNVLPGVVGTFTGTYYTKQPAGNNPVLLTDGKIEEDKLKTLAVASSGSTLTWEFEKCDITAIKLFTWWADGWRDGISVSKVEIRRNGESSFVDIHAPVVDYGRNDNNSGPALYAYLAFPDSSSIKDATGLKITFGTQDNDGTGFAEIEVTAHHAFWTTSELTYDDSLEQYKVDAKVVDAGISLAAVLTDINNNETLIPIGSNFTAGDHTLAFTAPNDKVYSVKITATAGTTDDVMRFVGRTSPRLSESNYDRYVDFTVGSGYTGTSTLENFPVLVRISDATISGLNWNDFAANGADIRFADENGVILAHEIDTWSTGLGAESLIWVKLPAMESGTTFRMYYKARTPDMPILPTTDVWTAYAGVWHFSEASGTAYDSTANHLDAAVMGSSSRDAQSIGVDDGVIGTMRRNGDGVTYGLKGSTSSYLKIDPALITPLNLGNTATISGWAKMAGTADNAYPRIYASKEVYNETTSGPQLQFDPGSVTIYKLTAGNGTAVAFEVPDITQNWLFLVNSYDNANVTAYSNGGAGSTKALGAPIVSWDKGLAFGSNTSGSEWAFCGWFDEFRLHPDAVTADWATAEYATVCAANFLTNDGVYFNGSFGAALLGPAFYDAADSKWKVGYEVLLGQGAIKCEITDSYGEKTTNIIAQAATVGAYTNELANIVSGMTYSVKLICGDSADDPIVLFAGEIYNDEVSIASGTDADFLLKQNGTFTVSRASDSAAACVYDLVVNYTIGGAAVSGTDYETLSGSVTIPAGDQSAVVEIVPIFHGTFANDLSVTLTLADGAYIIDGNNDSASIDIKAADDLWTLSGNLQSMTDCYGWELGCTVNGTNVAVGAIITSSSVNPRVLDLGKGIAGGGYIVTSVKKEAFKPTNGTIKSLVLPETLTSIGSYAFSGLSNLENVTPFLPDAVETIGDYAFSGCTKLTGDLRIGYGSSIVAFPGTFANSYAFQNTAIKSLDLGPSVTNTSSYTFFNCTSLGRVTVSDTLGLIGWGTFQNCSSLTNFVPFMPDSVWSVGKEAFNGCSKLTGDLRIGYGDHIVKFDGDDHENGNNFKGCAITGAHFGPNVKRLISEIFPDCSKLENIEFTEGITNIGWRVFQNCTSLTNVTPFLPDSLVKFGVGVFNGCTQLRGELRLGMGRGDPLILNAQDTKTDGQNGHQFRGTAITAAHIGGRVTSLPFVAFENCASLKRVYWYGTTAVPDVYDNAFLDSSLQICHFIPGENKVWNDYISTRCTTAAAFDAADFQAKFPDVRHPVGQIKLPSGSKNFQYYCNWYPKPVCTMLMVK